MNAIELAQQAYAPSTVALRTPRSVEAQLFTEITSRLSQPDTPYAQMVAAVHDNRQLWVTLAVDVADADNALPQDLRASIFFLAQFTEHHSQKVLRGEADLQPLIDINTSIMRGLRAKGAPT